MDIKQLQQSGGFVDETPVRCKGTWRGSDVEFYALRLSFGAIDAVYNRDNPTSSQSAELIRLGIRLGDNGEEQLTYNQAYQLDAELAMLFADKIMEINGVGDEEARTDPKASSQKTSSGSKSRSRSAAQSEKQKQE